MFKSAWVRTCLLAVVFTSGPGSHPVKAEIPPIYYGEERPSRMRASVEWPIWVSAEAAFSPTGELIESLFPPGYVGEVLAENSGDPQECVHFSPVEDAGGSSDRRTLVRAIRNSSMVVTGTVVSLDHGFMLGEPGQLFEVRSLAQIKGAKLETDRLFFFFPNGEFSAGPYRICVTASDYYSRPPVLGDEVLLLVDSGSSSPRSEFVRVDEYGVVVLGQDGNVSVPREFVERSAEDSTPLGKSTVGETALRSLQSKRDLLEFVSSQVVGDNQR